MNMHIQTPAQVEGPFEMLQKLIRADPGLSKDELFDDFRAGLAKSERHQRAVDFYYFSNMYQSARQLAGVDFMSRKDVATRNTSRQANVPVRRKLVEQIKAQIIVLNLQMPNGKKMRYCTGTEMARFGTAFKRIANQVGGKLVGDVLDEDGVRKLLEGRNLGSQPMFIALLCILIGLLILTIVWNPDDMRTNTDKRSRI